MRGRRESALPWLLAPLSALETGSEDKAAMKFAHAWAPIHIQDVLL